MMKTDMILSKNQILVFKSFDLYPVHPTAQQLFAFMRQSYPKIGLTTVYRALDALVKRGKLQKIKGLDNQIHYDHRLDLHPHFICMKCGKIADIDSNYWSVSVQKIERKMNVTCESVELNVQGVCSKCSEK